MTTTKFNRIKSYMLDAAHDHFEDWGEVNCTALAEDAATHFNDNPNDGSAIDSDYYDMAVEVAYNVENRR